MEVSEVRGAGKGAPVRLNPDRHPTFQQQPIRWLLRHWFAYYVGRDRRKCPSCGVRGTWRAYGLWFGDRQVRRWLCKWCGFYDGVDGRFTAVMDLRKGTWVLPIEAMEANFDPATLAPARKEHERRRKAGLLTTPREIAAAKKFNPF